MNYPLLMSLMAFALLVFSTRAGDALRKRAGVPKQEKQAESGPLLSATLTLLKKYLD